MTNSKTKFKRLCKQNDSDFNDIPEWIFKEIDKMVAERELPTKIAIVIKGGNCEAVYADHPVKVVILDYDNYKAGDEWTEEQETFLDLIKNKKLKDVY